MAHFCDVETQEGGGCRRRVNAATCKTHVNGPVPRKNGASDPTPARSCDPPSGEPLPQVPRTEAAPTEKNSITLSDAIAIVQQLPVDWRQEIAKQSVHQVGGRLWSEFLKHRTTGLCHPLASTARELLAVKASVGQLPGEAAGGAARRVGAPLAVVTMAERFVSGLGMTAPIEQKLAATAHALRVLGVFVCVIEGVVPSCQCLKELVAETVPREEFEARLRRLMESRLQT